MNEMGKLIWSGSRDDLDKISGEIGLEERKRIGATMNFAAKFRDLYYGREEYTSISGFFFNYKGERFKIDENSCMYDEELFWYYVCCLGLDKMKDVRKGGKRAPRAKKYVSENAKKYGLETEVAKLLILGKSPYGKPSKKQIEFEELHT